MRKTGSLEFFEEAARKYWKRRNVLNEFDKKSLKFFIKKIKEIKGMK